MSVDREPIVIGESDNESQREECEVKEMEGRKRSREEEEDVGSVRTQRRKVIDLTEEGDEDEQDVREHSPPRVVFSLPRMGLELSPMPFSFFFGNAPLFQRLFTTASNFIGDTPQFTTGTIVVDDDEEEDHLNNSKNSDELEIIDSLPPSKGSIDTGTGTPTTSSSTSNNMNKDNNHPPLGQLECAICLDKVRRVTATICGHIFCLECITQAINATSRCPLCKRKLTHNGIHPLYL